MGDFKKFLNKKVLEPTAIAAKHGVSLDQINKQLAMGIAVEKEHTTKTEIARQIALAHLGEKPDYYTKLKKVENDTQGNTGKLD